LARSVAEVLPVLLLMGIYTYLVWFFIFQIGFLRVNVIGQTFVVLILPTYYGFFLYLFREPRGRELVVTLILLALPLIYLMVLVAASVLRVF
jgi:hypothetical protein